MSSTHLKSPGPSAADEERARGVSQTVAGVIADVRTRGDEAVREYSVKFDNWSPPSFALDRNEVEEIVATVPDQVIADIAAVQDRVRRFAEHQLASLRDFEVETEPGVLLGQRIIPVSSVGAYVPGGRYPLVASAHMTVLTAKVAGVIHRRAFGRQISENRYLPGGD
jgi:sulfopropanediol 3-dehydrogenase